MNTYNKYYGNKKGKLKKRVVNYISKILLSVIFFLLSIIYINTSNENKALYTKYIFTDSISFAKVNNWYQKNFGSIVPLEDISATLEVFNETLNYNTMDKYLDGYILSVDNNYIVPAINSGVVVYIGEKDNYGNTLIVQGVDGIDIWYGNIDTSDYNLYDYITKGTPLGLTKDNKLYLVFMKDNNYLSYEEYNQN